MMLDQEGFECDPINKREGDTPLHTVVRWINEQGEEGWEYGAELVAMMVEAGSDARFVPFHESLFSNLPGVSKDNKLI